MVVVVVVAAAVVLVVMVVAVVVVVLISPHTLYMPSATVLICFVLKLLSIWK